jgi:hypothetical protein
MVTAPKPDKPESLGPEGRRSTRLPISIPITISGRDASGEAFRENVRTLVINTHGARIGTYHQLSLGAEILIENPALVRSVKTSVVWLGKKPAAHEPYEVGLQLFEAENIWGIEFPPDDWQAESPAGAAVPETAKAAPPAGGKPAPGRAAAPAVAKPAEVGPPEQAEVPTEAALRRFNQLATEAAERHSVLFGEKLTKVMSQVGLQTQTRLQDEARQLQEKTLRSMEQEVNARATRLQSTYGKVEALLSKSYEVEKSSRAHLEKTQEKLKEASRQAVEDALEESKKKARHDFETLEADFVKQLHQRLEREVTAEMEALRKAAGPRLTALADEHLAKLAGEFKARQAQALAETQAQLRDAAEAASARFQQEVCKPAEDTTASLRTEAQKAGEKAAQTLHQLRKESEELTESTTRQLQGQAQEAREKLKKELSESGRELLAETENRLAGLVNSSVDSLTTQGLTEFKVRCTQVTDEHSEALSKQLEDSKAALAEWAEQRRSHLEAHLEKIEAASQTARETLEKRTEELTQTAAEKIRQETETLANQAAEDFRAKLAEVFATLHTFGPKPGGRQAPPSGESEHK